MVAVEDDPVGDPPACRFGKQIRHITEKENPHHRHVPDGGVDRQLAKHNLGRGGVSRRIDPASRRQQPIVDNIFDTVNDLHHILTACLCRSIQGDAFELWEYF